MNDNPQKAVDAILKPAPLSLSKLALLEKIQSPILRADARSLHDNLIAIWIFKTPIAECVKNLDKRQELALEMSEKMSGEEYGIALAELLDAVGDFFDMMPRAESGEEEDEEKKTSHGSVTDGLPNSQNGLAEDTITKSPKCFTRFLRFILRFFIGATHKRQAN